MIQAGSSCGQCAFLIVCFYVSLLKACALQFLHERNISHLDLKPQNILLCGSVLKLAGDNMLNETFNILLSAR